MDVNSVSACWTLCFFTATSNTIRTGQFNSNTTMSIKIHQNTTRTKIFRNHSVPPKLKISISCRVNFERLSFTGKEPCITLRLLAVTSHSKIGSIFFHLLIQLRPNWVSFIGQIGIKFNQNIELLASRLLNLQIIFYQFQLYRSFLVLKIMALSL